MLKLFTTSTCAQCPIVISGLDKNGFEYEKVSAEESPEQAAEYDIMSVPTIVDSDEQLHVGAGACMAFIGQNS